MIMRSGDGEDLSEEAARRVGRDVTATVAATLRRALPQHLALLFPAVLWAMQQYAAVSRALYLIYLSIMNSRFHDQKSIDFQHRVRPPPQVVWLSFVAPLAHCKCKIMPEPYT